jgi:hypothetical protein
MRPSLRISLAVIAGFALSATQGPAMAATITYEASLNGATEIPANSSPGTGFAIVTVDTVADTMHVLESFSGLESPTTASHIHCCAIQPATVGVATTVPTFPGFPLGVMSGIYDMTFNMTLLSSFNPAFVTANGGTAASAFAALLAGLNGGETYINIHTNMFPGGEIRGILAPTPLPGALPLAATGLGLLGLLGWRRKRKAQPVA